MTDDLFADLDQMTRSLRNGAGDDTRNLDALDSLGKSVQTQVIENKAFGRIGQFGQFFEGDQLSEKLNTSSRGEIPPNPHLETGGRARAYNELSKLSNSSNGFKSNGIGLDTAVQKSPKLSKVSNSEDLAATFDERAAILEYDEGLTRAEAERLAEQLGFDPRPASEPAPTPAVAVPAAEYDAHLDAMIAALPAASIEASLLMLAKRQGRVVARGDEMIFTRGR